MGFVLDNKNTVRLVTLEHTIATHPKLLMGSGPKEAFRLEKPVRLLYTPQEWVAFYYGVKAGEFQDFSAATGDTLVRDSKDPEGPVLVLSKDTIQPFFDAIEDGKYDLPSAQEASIAASFSKIRNTALPAIPD